MISIISKDQVKLNSGVWEVKPIILPKKELSRTPKKIRQIFYFDRPQSKLTYYAFKIKIITKELLEKWNDFRTIEQNTRWNDSNSSEDVIVISRKQVQMSLTFYNFYISSPEKCKKYLNYQKETTENLDTWIAYAEKIEYELKLIGGDGITGKLPGMWKSSKKYIYISSVSPKI